MKNFREKELVKLEHLLHLENQVVLLGPQGIGKKSLIKGLLRSNKARFLWNKNFRSGSVTDALGIENQNLETALPQIDELFTQYEYIIWENLHLISAQNLNTLFSYLSVFSDQKHIILCSDLEALGLKQDFAELKLESLNKERTKDYLDTYFPNRNIDLEKAYDFSKGIPLRINLFCGGQSEDLLKQDLLDELDTEEAMLLFLPYFCDRSISLAEAESILEISPEKNQNILTKLDSKFLIDWDANSQRGRFQHSDFSRLLLKKSQQSEVARNCIQRIIRSGINIAPILKLRLSLLTENQVLFSSCLEKLSLNSLGKYSESLLRWIANYFVIWQENIDFHSPLQVRKISQILFSGGKRENCIEYIEKYLERHKNSFGFEEEQARLILDYLSYLNRTGKTKKAFQLSNRYESFLHQKMLPELLIEKGLSQAGIDRMEAINYYDHALEKLAKKDLVFENDTNKESVIALAQFEKARVLIGLEQFHKASECLSVASKHFLVSELYYHSAMARLNQSWVYLKLNDWDRLEVELNYLKEIANKYSYANVQAGAEIIQATKHRHFLNFKDAIDSLNRCSRILDKNSPTSTFVMYHSERARLYLQMRIQTEAGSSAKELISIGRETQSKITTEIGEQLLFLSQLYEKSQSEIHDFIDDKLKTDSIDLYDLIFVYDYLDSEIKNKHKFYFNNSPIGKIRQIEHKIKHSIQTNDQAIWTDIKKYSDIANSCSDAFVENVFIKLLQIELTKDTVDTKILLDEAKIELCRISNENPAKYFFDNWWYALANKENPLKQAFWYQSPFYLKYAYGPLLHIFYKEKPKNYHILCNDGEFFSDDTEAAQGKDLVFIHDTNEVFVKGKLKKQMIKKVSLLQLLTHVLISSPEGISKESLAKSLWKEDYDPVTHDSRIYTSIQRLRISLGIKTCILVNHGSYRWNPKVSFALIRKGNVKSKKLQRTQNLILSALEEHQKSWNKPIGRKDLVEITGNSDATIKRELAKLLELGLIQRKGSGRATRYCLQAPNSTDRLA